MGLEQPKALVPFRGRPLVGHAVSAALASGLTPVIVVAGHGGDEVATALEADGFGAVGSSGAAVTVVHNPEWAEGIASSLRCALRELEGHAEVEAVCIGLADQPLIGAEAYRRLATRLVDHGSVLAVATYGGVRANPVLLARSIWADALLLEGDIGARALMGRHPVTEVPCDETGDPADIDTMEDLRRLSG